MKYSITILFFLVGCTHHASFKHTAADTTKTSAIYLLTNGLVNGSQVFRITHDSLMLDTSNKDEPTLTWKRDTFYFVPVALPVFDSLHHPVIDSVTKQQKTTIQPERTDKENICNDYNKVFKN